MSNATDRRSFLRRTAALGATGLAASVAAPEEATAISPIERTANHKFKFSLAAYSYRGLLSGKDPKLKLIDFVDDCARFGLDGAELTSYYFPPTADEAYFRRIKAECFRRGLDVTGTAVGNDFCHPPGAKRDEEIAKVKAWVDRADWMDAPVIRIFSGKAKSQQTTDEAGRLAVEAIEECCEYAGGKGVFLALENHGGLTAEAAGLLSLVRAVDSPWFGVNLDTGNFHSSDVYAELEQLAPYALNVQVKVVIKPAGGGTQPSDFKRLAKILRDVGYRGYIVLEYEESGDPRQECPEFIDQLREAFV